MPLKKWQELLNNKLTIIHTYYNEKKLLETQLERWNCYNLPVSIILIDDGSQKIPAIDVVEKYNLKENIDLSLYRVKDDIGFNSHGCRNLAARLANSEWLLYLDIDYTLQPSHLKRLISDPLDPNSWYELNAKFMGQGDTYMALNQILIPRKIYLETGGYDESFVPFHHGDREFLHRLTKNYKKDNLDWLILTCRRGGRKAIITDDIKIPVYDDENMVFYTPMLDESKIQRITSKINFDWERIL